jgi:hypothetical protein
MMSASGLRFMGRLVKAPDSKLGQVQIKSGAFLGVSLLSMTQANKRAVDSPELHGKVARILGPYLRR